MYANFTGFPEKSLVLDNNLQTFHQPDGKTDQLWFLRLKLIYKMKWILVSIRGGIVYFIYHIKDWKSKSYNIVCKKLNTICVGIWCEWDTERGPITRLNVGYIWKFKHKLWLFFTNKEYPYMYALSQMLII